MHKLPVALALTGVVTVAGGPALAQAATLKHFADKADAICVSANKKADALKEPQTPEEFLPYLQKTLKIVQPAQAKLQALTLPDRKRAIARQAVRLSAKDVATYLKYIDAITAGADIKATTDAFTKKLDASSKVENRDWRALGARHCVG